jgi:hypothetical protein
LSSHELTALGLEPAGIDAVEMLRDRPTHAVFRVTDRGASYILKRFVGPGPFRELVAYNLLPKLGLSTLPVHGRAERAILLEDLAHSVAWRMATEEDNSAEATGVAVAAWYRKLHAAGYTFLATEPAPFPAWIDEVTSDNLAQAAGNLGLDDEPAVRLSLVVLDTLTVAFRRCRQTFNYEDFALENLALSRAEPRRAVVFDYDCFSVGTAYADWRNVMYSLAGPAAGAFAAAYGITDPLERLLDEPLSAWQGLIIAARRPHLPGWAEPLLTAVRDGSLATSIGRAVAAVS